MNKELIVQYMAQGIIAEKIATILGCAPSYIAEVKGEDWFPAALEEAKKKIKKTEQEAKLEDEYIKLESSLLHNIKDQMPFAEFKDLVKMTEVLIRRKQSSIPVGGMVTNNIQQNTVILQIPAAVAPEIVLNSQSEILAVGEQTMAPMSTHSVRKLFDEIKYKREEPTRMIKDIEENRVLETLPEDF